MDFKTLLISSLLILILLSTLSFGFLTYTIYNGGSKAAVTDHQLIFYIVAVLHVALFGVSGTIFYKA